MADREAAVRLNLAASGFLTALQTLQKEAEAVEQSLEDIGDGAEEAGKETKAFTTAAKTGLKDVEREAKGVGSAVDHVGDAAERSHRKASLFTKSFKSGIGAAKESLSELGGALRTHLAQAATLGGALSVGAGIHGATELISTYKDLAFAIQAGTGKAQDWRAIQGDVESVGSRWKQSNDKIAASYRKLWDDIGDADFARAAIDEVAKGATAGAGSVEQLTSVVGALNEKFGITASQLPESMAAVIAMSNKGGLSMEDFSATLGMVGSAAKAIGIQGPEGLKRVVGMMNLAEGSTKSLKGAVTGVSALMADLADPDKIKNIQKLTGLKLTDKKGHIRDDAMEQIIVKTKGSHEELAKLFSGEQLKIMSGFGETFAKAFEDTKGTDKKRSAAALDAFDAAVEAASEQTLTAADVQRQATARLKDPARQLDDAMNRFKRSFEKKEVVEAIDKLATHLPKLASVLGKAVEFAAEHPALAGMALAGGRPAFSGAASMGGELLAGFGKKQAATIGAEIAAVAATSGKWGAAAHVFASVVGPALGAYLAYEVGKNQIDKMVTEDASNEGGLAAARAQAGAAESSGDPVQIAAARARLSRAIADAEKGEQGATGAVKRWFRGAASMTGDVQFDTQENAIARAKADLTRLNRTDQASDKAASSMERAAQAAERLSRSFDRAAGSAGGGGASNGLPPKPGNGSGSSAD